MEEKKREELQKVILKEVEKYTPVADQTFLADLISFKVESFIQAELDRAREEGRREYLKEVELMERFSSREEIDLTRDEAFKRLVRLLKSKLTTK